MNKKHHPLNVALPYFKVLLATEPYQRYCEAKKCDDKLAVAKLSNRYPNLESIWEYWGDIYCFDKKLNEVKYFEQWFELNSFKFHRISFRKFNIIKEV